MTTQPPDEFSDPIALQAHFNEASNVLLLVDRKARVKQANQAAGQIVEKSLESIKGVSYGEGLGCIHIGDHPDGCGYGSICGDCFIHQAVKRSFKTKQPVEASVGVLSISSREGVKRPQWKVSTSPVSYEGRLHALISIEPCSESNEA